MLVIQGYVILMIAIGWKLTTSSLYFKQMSLWKQIVTLAISPLLLVRDISKDFKRS